MAGEELAPIEQLIVTIRGQRVILAGDLARIYNSPRAVQMSVFVVRAFVRMRAALGDTRELARKLAAPSPTPPKTSAPRNRLPRRGGGAPLTHTTAAAVRGAG